MPFLVALLLSCAMQPEFPLPWFQCAEGQELRSAIGTEGPYWWTLSAEDTPVVGLAEAWAFPAWEGPDAADRTWWCTDDQGTTGGSFGQEHGAARITGELDPDGRPHGEWVGVLDGSLPAFTGTYDHGERVGTWRFTGPGGAEVATGGFARDRPHGTWIVKGPQKTTETRYVYGKAHGSHHEVFSDGREVLGRYFNGTKNYEWEYVEQVDGQPQVVKEEAWKYDTFVVEWDPRTQANPIPDLALPGPPVGAQAEGMCKVHSRCASNAYLTVLLAGGALDPEGTYDMPVLVDFADPDARQPDRQRIILAETYSIGDAVVSEDRMSSRVPAEIVTRCVVHGPDGPVELHEGIVAVTLDLREEQGVWKLVRPLPDLYVRLDVFLDHIQESDPAWYARVRKTCIDGPRSGDAG